ncbi:MAG: small multi-drug export protein [Halioglobus sp.]|nr:small multi-drug export protein [Halioglobus sp.]
MIYILVLAVTTLRSPELTQELVGMTAINILFGRAAAMSFGYSIGHGHMLVISVNMIVETLLVLLVFPLFVFTWQHLVEFEWLRKPMNRLHGVAEGHQDKIKKYGVPSLFLFVFFPFWMTGPLVGCVIGYLLGMRLTLTLTVVLLGTYVAMAVWALVLHEIHDQIAAYNPAAPMILVIILILVAVAAQVLRGLHDENRPGPN